MTLSLYCSLPSCSQDAILLHKTACCILSWRWSRKPCVHIEISLLLSFSCPTQWWWPMSSYLYLTLRQWCHPQPKCEVIRIVADINFRLRKEKPLPLFLCLKDSILAMRSPLSHRTMTTWSPGAHLLKHRPNT